MNKHQFIAVVAAIVAVIFLYSLPRVVVDNDKTLREEELTDGKIIDADEDISLFAGLSLSDSIAISRLTSLTTNELSENNIIFADSLVNLYIKYGADARASGLVKKIEKKDQRKAGFHYYHLMNRAEDANKTKFYASKVQKLLTPFAEDGDLDAKVSLAMTYMTTQNPMQGVMMLREVIEADPEHVNALYNLGLLSIQSGQYDKAVTRFEKILELSPDNEQAKLNLGISYYETGQYKKSKETLKTLLSSEDKQILPLVDEFLQKMN